MAMEQFYYLCQDEKEYSLGESGTDEDGKECLCYTVSFLFTKVFIPT